MVNKSEYYQGKNTFTKNHNNRKTQFSFPLLPFMFREKEDRVSFHRMPQDANDSLQVLCRSHNYCESECNFCVTPRRQLPYLTCPFLQLLHFFFYKIPQVLVRKDDNYVPFMAGHLKITYLSAESSYRSLDSFLTTANRKEPLGPKLTTQFVPGRGSVI